MNIPTKLGYAKQAIRNIATHDDVDSVVRVAALEELGKYISQQKSELAARLTTAARDAVKATE